MAKALHQKTANVKRKIRISAVSHEERKMKGSPAGAQSLSRLEISRETKTDILARIPAVTQGPV
jgi:hypothetical protein